MTHTRSPYALPHALAAACCALAALMCFASPAAAQDGTVDDDAIRDGIAVDIRGGVARARIPLAIPPIRGGNGELNQEIMQTLVRDLSLSGYFQILPRDSFFFDMSKDGMTASSINFENWTNVGAAGLVKSAYTTSGDQTRLDFRFFQVTSGKQVGLRWQPQSVSRPYVRREVHDFANALIEYYTGHRGVFGTRIAFAARTKPREKHIYVMDMDGANLRRITKDGSVNIMPSFADGGVFYTSFRDGNPNLYFWKNGKTRRVSNHPGQNVGAAWCRKTKALAVVLSKGGKNTDIYTIDSATGKIIRRLTDHWSIDTSPTWSPDCSKLAFVSDRTGSPQIHVMNADGSGVKQLTFKGKYNTSPSWSPKGNTIAFSGRDGRRQFDIFTVDLEGNMTRLTQNQGANKDPSYSPGGQYIVFTSTRQGGASRVYLMSADGRNQTAITRKGGGYATPSWSR